MVENDLGFESLDLECQAGKLTCEAAKEAEAQACNAAALKCSSSRAVQNAIYLGEAAGKVGQQQIDLATCLAAKQAGVLRFSGDSLLPMHYNLFVRAGVIPFTVFPATLAALSPGLGEKWLQGEIEVRLLCSDPTLNLRCNPKGDNPEGTTDPRDNTGDDLNDIVMLLMTRLSPIGPTPESESAIARYRDRSHSYGSYFSQYCATHGSPRVGQDKVLRERILAGLTGSWRPEVSGAYGAVRRYHIWTAGANPRLATMYEPILRCVLGLGPGPC
jgi:hypothetical protein